MRPLRSATADRLAGRDAAGLVVRILDVVKREYAELLARADAIFIEERHKADLYDASSQAFAVFLPAKSVGGVGDALTKGWSCCACGPHYRALGALAALVTGYFKT